MTVWDAIRRKFCFLIIALLIALTMSVRAAHAQGFVVEDFSVDIYLKQEGFFDVVEKYHVNFFESKHGIFRDIQTEYTILGQTDETEKRNLFIKNIVVPNHKYKTNYKFEQKASGQVSIKIGDKDKVVTGAQVYEIHYRVYNGFLFEGDSVKFYWNLKPSGWQAPFMKMNFRIHAPQDASISDKNSFIYSGTMGTSSVSDKFNYTYKNEVFSGVSASGFISVPGESVTALIKLPAHLIDSFEMKVSLWEKYGWIGILLVLLILFWRIWWIYGKDDPAHAITSYYPPKGIDPAMAGYLINDLSDTNDVIALLPQWASLGYIRIEEVEKSSLLSKGDMRLIKLKNIPDSSPNYEQQFFYGLFSADEDSVLMSSLKNTFYVTMGLVKKELGKEAQKFYHQSSNRIMNISMVSLLLLGILLCVLFLYVFGIVPAVISVLVCVFLVIMSFYLKKKNKQGTEVLSELKGFKIFIKMAELERIKVLFDEDPAYFEKTMSFALAFGLLNDWAKKFDTLNIPPPTWYSSSGNRMLGMKSFSKSFSSHVNTAKSYMVSSPSSSKSGGGSSGGGFGGGGGGSW